MLHSVTRFRFFIILIPNGTGSVSRIISGLAVVVVNDAFDEWVLSASISICIASKYQLYHAMEHALGGLNSSDHRMGDLNMVIRKACKSWRYGCFLSRYEVYNLDCLYRQLGVDNLQSMMIYCDWWCGDYALMMPDYRLPRWFGSVS